MKKIRIELFIAVLMLFAIAVPGKKAIGASQVPITRSAAVKQGSNANEVTEAVTEVQTTEIQKDDASAYVEPESLHNVSFSGDLGWSLPRRPRLS